MSCDQPSKWNLTPGVFRRVKLVEYNKDGSIKKIEYYEDPIEPIKQPDTHLELNRR